MLLRPENKLDKMGDKFLFEGNKYYYFVSNYIIT